MTEVYPPGYVARLIDCQGALVRALNTAANALGEAGNTTAAHAACVSRDEALALLENVLQKETHEVSK